MINIGWKYVDCVGEAHRNGHIDHCMFCAPKWGKILVPEECKNAEDWFEIRSSLSPEVRYAVLRERDRVQKLLEAEHEGTTSTLAQVVTLAAELANDEGVELAAKHMRRARGHLR